HLLKAGRGKRSKEAPGDQLYGSISTRRPRFLVKANSHDSVLWMRLNCFAVKLNLSLKYVLTITTLVCVVLVGSSALGVYVSTRRSLEQLNLLQQEKAFAAAARIETYMREIVQQTEWASPPLVPPDPDLETLKFGYLKLLRQVPAITAAAWLDPQGLEKLRVSRLEMNR